MTLSPYLQWTRVGELDVLALDAPFGRARIAAQGAHLLDWAPAGQAPVLWLSEAAVFRTAKAIRGGIPLCWPWFGPHGDRDKPAHGFARTLTWTLAEAQADAEAATLVWTLTDDDTTRALWPHAFALRYTQRFGRDLSLTLDIRHGGDTPASFTFALHSYFAVADVSAALIEGLDGARCVDKLSDETATQRGVLTFDAATDRVYLGAGGPFRLTRGEGLAPLELDATGCPSAIVWNPWAEAAARMADMDAHGWRHMVCLENGAALSDAVTLAPGESYRATLTVR